MLWLCLDWNAFCIFSLEMCWDLISPSLAYGWDTSCGFWCFLESCMMPTCLEWSQWCLRTFSWRTTFFENVFLDVDDQDMVFGNRLEFVLPRMMYLPDNNNFQIALYFKSFLHGDVLEMILEKNVFFSGLAFCKATGRCICNTCKCMNMGMVYFLLQLDFVIWNSGDRCMCARSWFKHVARQKLREAQQIQWQVAWTRDFVLLCVCVCEKKVIARSSFGIWVGFWLACFCKFYRHPRWRSDRKRRNGVTAYATRLVVVTLNFSRFKWKSQGKQTTWTQRKWRRASACRWSTRRRWQWRWHGSDGFEAYWIRDGCPSWNRRRWRQW